jgi:hypothetical protein
MSDGGTSGEPPIGAARYHVCDGSRDVRLALQLTGGGPLDRRTASLTLYGHQFLFVRARDLRGARQNGARSRLIDRARRSRM